MSALPGKPASNSGQSGQEHLLTVSPGERLQRARKDRNLEVGDMAERLNLSPGVVRALEADDYRMLPNATFVKGYLRSYARALDISGDDLVRAYEAITGCNQAEKIEPIAAPMISDTRKNQRNLLLALVVLILVGVGFWYVSSGREDDTASASAPEIQPVVEDDAAGQTLQDSAAPSVNPPVVVTRPMESAEDIMEAAQSMEEPVAAEEPPVTEEPPGDLQQNALEDQGPAPQLSAPPVAAPASEPVAAPTAAVPASGVEQPASAVANGTGLLNLRFQGECWVEVRDGSGRMVFSSLKRAGEEVTLRAATPIHVKLGNGDVVDVQYNHEPVAFATRPDRKVVRLSLGE